MREAYQIRDKFPMMPKIQWGVLGAATIAVETVIPAMQGDALFRSAQSGHWETV